MPTSPKSPSRRSSIIFFPSMVQRSQPLHATIPTLKSASTEKNVIMRYTSTPPSPASPISAVRNMNNGVFPFWNGIDSRIDARYLNGSTPARGYRLETFRSMGTLSHTSKKQIRCYFITKCNFFNPNPSIDEMRDLRICGDKTFLEKVTENTLAIYQQVVDAVLQRSGPCSSGDVAKFRSRD